MKQFLKNLIEGKYAIGYTLNTIANMVPREIRWLNKIPVLSQVFLTGQLFWFITKIMFFALFISWFKPQYQHAGAKVALFVILVALIFAAAWMMKRELARRASLK
jgi:hypothetical protein